MTDKNMLLALFPDLDPAARGIEKLRELGLTDEHMNVISGIPVTEAMLGRPQQPSNVPRLAGAGAVGGFLVGCFFAFATPVGYPLNVGGQPIIPGPPSVVVIFEMTMLGMLVSTFLGVFLDSRFPSYAPKEYVAEVSDGKIAILIECAPEMETKIESAMTALGAESVKHAEAQTL
jgi:hypothetical protein